jgi:hypothetical protein
MGIIQNLLHAWPVSPGIDPSTCCTLTVAIRQEGALDWGHIERHLGPLAEIKEQPEIMDALARLRRPG